MLRKWDDLSAATTVSLFAHALVAAADEGVRLLALVADDALVADKVLLREAHPR